MTDSPQAVLGRIPGWEQAEINELEGGLTNRTWLVNVGDQKGVLKIDAAPRA